MKRIRTNIIAAAVALCAAPAAMAVPAYPGLIKVTQDDGTEIEVYMRGDEYGHFYTTADNHLIVRDNGVFCYAVPGDARTPLVSSGIRATGAKERSAKVQEFLRTVDTEAALQLFTESRGAIADRAQAVREKVMKERTEFASRAGNIPEGTSMLISDVPTRGTQPGLVVLVQYQDIKFHMEDPVAFYKDYMMKKGFNEYGAAGSANDFFVSSSRGQYNPQFDVYGVVTLKEKMRYYGRNIDGGTTGLDAHPEEMVLEAIDALDDIVDFSKYDTDGDGKIDNITVIYAGEGEATSSNTLNVWPHAAYIQSGMGITKVVDGVIVDHYNCLNEWWRAYNRPAGLGTFVHEFSHILGLPDLYDTQYSLAADETVTPGRWSVMDNGPYNGAGLCPPLHSAYEAYCLGWLTPKELTGPCTMVLEPFQGGAFYVATDKEDEFFMFETRYREGFDAELPADGLLIWHIDYSRRMWSRNIVNNEASHLRIRLMCADNDFKPGTDNRDAYPTRMGSYRDFNASTSPAFLSWSGYDPGLPLSDITLGQGGRITAKVAGGGDMVGIDGVGIEEAEMPVEWYTLQGVRVAEPKAGNIYIRRQGSDVKKLAL